MVVLRLVVSVSGVPIHEERILMSVDQSWTLNVSGILRANELDVGREVRVDIVREADREG